MIKYSKKELIKGIKNSERVLLSRAITLAESQKEEHRRYIHDIIEKLLPDTGKSLRIGITGVPGVGKSTFIESFGAYLINLGHKVAVLTIDPSSKQSGGSILGDKTRMPKLAVADNAYIRPSPAGISLGGVAGKTREAMLLCEAAGYNIVLVETVGVGQSETAVSEMVDVFLLLMLSGAGDELQGIKKGIMESADIIAINKCDGDNIKKSMEAQMEYKRAVQMFPRKFENWITEVLTVSALENVGMEEIWQKLLKFESLSKKSNHFERNRSGQLINWFETELHFLLNHHLMKTKGIQDNVKRMKSKISKGEISSFRAADMIFYEFLSKVS
ncbi:methylmalonyl Co-A mutase-associated GTPase MeaB [Hyphobacterium sp. CCMP332]|nr:methylmalonyl Co-A mutase-associated GTPase MeaB [Hyphobacterium sp. CCMP332]